MNKALIKYLSVLFALIFLAESANAFLFFSRKKYSKELKKIEKAYESSNCLKVEKSVKIFFDKNPSADSRRLAYSYLGKCYEKENFADKALNVYKIALELYPDDKGFKKALARLYFENGFFEKSADLFSGLVLDYDCDWETHKRLALSLTKIGFYERASESFEVAAKLNNYKDNRLLKEYATCLLKLKKYGRALEMAEKMSGSSDKKMVLARIFLYLGKYGKSLDNLKAARKMSPERKDISLYIMIVELIDGECDKADNEAKKFLMEKPDNSVALLVKASVEFKKGNKKKSLKIMKKITAKTDGFAKKLAESFIHSFKGKNEN